MKTRWTWTLVCCLFVGTVKAQSAESPTDRKNTITLLMEDANDSSHIVAGTARQRKLVTLGAAYTRRVVRFAGTELGYRVEVRPLVFESDPVQIVNDSFTSNTSASSAMFTQATISPCRPFTSTIVVMEPPPTGTVTSSVTATCGRQWTFGQAFTPFGFQYTAAIRHRVQPYLLGTLGYLYTSRPVPVSTAEAFNFVVDVGVGVQVYRRQRTSIAFEARVRHISNRNTAQANPGMDMVTYGVSYSFGR